MPDDNPFREDDNPFREDDGAGTAFQLAAGETFINNLLGLPGAVGELGGRALAGTTAAIEGGSALLTGGDFDFANRAERQLGKFPASALASIPRPKIADIGSAVRSIPSLVPGGEAPSESFQRESDRFASEKQAREQEHPTASNLGSIGGDVMSLLTGRLPFAKSIQRGEKALEAPVKLAFGSAVNKTFEPGAVRWANRVIDSPVFRKLARGTGRAAETGFEALMLDMVNGDDLLETAGVAAGGQVAGSLMLSAGHGLTSGGFFKAGGKIAVTAASAAALFQIFKDVTPGGEDNFISSLEAGYEKVSLAILAGVVAGLAGSGRGRSGRFAEDFPKIMDSFAVVPRGAMISMLEEWRDSPPESQQKLELVTGKLIESPQFFGSATADLQKGMEGGNLLQTIESLETKNAAFAKQLFSLSPPDLSSGN